MNDKQAALLLICLAALLLLRGIMRKRKRGRKRVFIANTLNDD